VFVQIGLSSSLQIRNETQGVQLKALTEGDKSRLQHLIHGPCESRHCQRLCCRRWIRWWVPAMMRVGCELRGG